MTALVIRLGPPLSVSVRAESVKVARLTGSLNVTSMDETVELRGLGETAAIDDNATAGSPSAYRSGL